MAGSFARGLEWSLLPIQTPTARPGWSSLVGARKPYVARSRASFEVPVLAATGRRPPPLALKTASFSDQMGFCFLSVLPARMSLTRKAACGETASRARVLRRLPDDLAVGRLDLEDHPRRDPDAAVGQRADRRTSGPAAGPRPCPSAPASPAWRYASRPPVKRSPSASAVLSTWLLPTRCEGPDGRDVERVLERLADEDRAALELVRVARRPILAAVEHRRHVEQEAARRQTCASRRRSA